ncbi:MAG TPA: hypothetical protein VIN40_05365 [Candidatus Tyrphobacter sp.]
MLATPFKSVNAGVGEGLGDAVGSALGDAVGNALADSLGEVEVAVCACEHPISANATAINAVAILGMQSEVRRPPGLPLPARVGPN